MLLIFREFGMRKAHSKGSRPNEDKTDDDKIYWEDAKQLAEW